MVNKRLFPAPPPSWSWLSFLARCCLHLSQELPCREGRQGGAQAAGEEVWERQRGAASVLTHQAPRGDTALSCTSPKSMPAQPIQAGSSVQLSSAPSSSSSCSLAPGPLVLPSPGVCRESQSQQGLSRLWLLAHTGVLYFWLTQSKHLSDTSVISGIIKPSGSLTPGSVM